MRPSDEGLRSLPVPFAEDPVGRARKINHMWAIRHRIDAGSQDPSGRIRRENPLVIKPGDFVDVAVNIQIVSLRLPRGQRGAELMFVPQAVVKLVSSDESMVRVSDVVECSISPHVSQMMLKTVADEYTFLEEASTTASRRETGFTFETDETMEN